MKEKTQTHRASRGFSPALLRVAAAIIACFASYSVHAFDYAESDLLVGFRQPSGNYEMVVNLGRATNLATFARSNPGTRISITNYPMSMLSSAFSDLGDIHWSVFASVVTIGQVDPPYAGIWVTRPRDTLGTQSTPWNRRLAFSQSGMASAIHSVGLGGKSAPGSTANATAVVIDAGASFGYAAQVGPLGDFKGKWLGVVEGATPTDFVDSKGTSRIDLYYCPPDPTNTKKPGEYLGYFDFNWDGTMTFTAAGGVANPAPTLTNVSPASGLAGDSIALTGSNFASGAKVLFGGVMATTVTVNSGSSITAIAPAHDPGIVDVVVQNLDGQSATLAGSFTYNTPPPPPQPRIGPLSLSGSTLLIVTSGATNSTEIVYLASTADAPSAAWTPIATNTVGSDGLFTNSIPTTGAAGFIRVKIP